MPPTVQPSPCERLGLSSNPFHPDATARSALAWHVEQDADRQLWELQREILHGRGPHMVAVVGGRGAGKSHRLLMAGQRALQAGGFQAIHPVADCRPDALVARLASATLAGCRLGGLDHALSSPRWYRNVVPMTKRGPQQADPASDGPELARALNANAPAFLLIDDLHTLPISRAADAYVETLLMMREHLDPGVLVVWTCDPQRIEAMVAREPGLLDDDLAPIRLGPLSDGQAQRLVAARLATHRLSDAVDPLFPFRAETVDRMNRAAGGNPHALVRMAELLLEATGRRGAFEIAAEAVDDSLLVRPVSSLNPSPAARRLPQ